MKGECRRELTGKKGIITPTSCPGNFSTAFSTGGVKANQRRYEAISPPGGSFMLVTKASLPRIGERGGKILEKKKTE